MYERPPVVALRDYLSKVVAIHPVLAEAAQSEELRQRVCAMVDELKAAGWPPERVIVAAKQVSEDAGICTTLCVPSGITPMTQQDVAIANVVSWCIQRYYGEDTATAEKPAVR